jgi:hypothetical protein
MFITSLMLRNVSRELRLYSRIATSTPSGKNLRNMTLIKGTVHRDEQTIGLLKFWNMKHMFRETVVV